MRNLLSRFLVAIPLAAFFLGVAGCGKSEPLYPVSGKVTHNKAPLKGGIITFLPDESKGNKSKFSPSGKIDNEGNYTLMTDGRAGAPAGHYKVTVNTEMPGMAATTPGDPGKPAPLTPPGGVKIAPKYKDVSQTPLTREVVTSGASPTHYDFTVE